MNSFQQQFWLIIVSITSNFLFSMNDYYRVEANPITVTDEDTIAIYDELSSRELYRKMADIMDSIQSTDDIDEYGREPDEIGQNNGTQSQQSVISSPIDRCLQPIRRGVCRALIPRWSYDATLKTCKEFKFGGCDGNGNNFPNQKQCMDVCKGL